jgi:type IV pilus assembly protein PilC
MAKFTYTAEKNDGEVYKGVADAKDRYELYAQVRREGGRIISLTQDRGANPLCFTYWNNLLRTVSDYEKILFARNLGAMLSAGLPLSRALSVEERQTRNPRLSGVITQLSSDVRRGATFHDALAIHTKVFSPLFIAMVRAGEEGGDLAKTLLVIAEQMERMYGLRKKVQGALIYPSIIVVAIIGIGALMMTQVVPTLAQTFEEMGAELPASTQVVIAISDFLVEYTVVAIAGVLVFAGMLYAAARTRIGKRLIDLFFLRVPVVGTLVREVNAARTARTLSSLLTAGVDILTALQITQDVIQNSYFRDVIKDARASVGKGEQLAATFARNEHLYPPFVGEMIAVGEETGQVTEMLKCMSSFYEDEVDRKTKDLSTIIEPLLMVFIGAAVGFFAISMISPIYQLSENI